MVGDDTIVTTQVGGGGPKVTRKFTDTGMEVVRLFGAIYKHITLINNINLIFYTIFPITYLMALHFSRQWKKMVSLQSENSRGFNHTQNG